jgi:hypothetical protein
MNNQADALHSQVVLLRMQGKTTEELQAIWQENDKSKWSKEDFDAVQKVLMERVEKLPEQKSLEKTDEPIKLSGQTSSSDNVSTKYPYLTAYVGFVALFLLFGLVLGFIPFLSQFGLIIQVIGGFYIFKFVVEKNVLPQIQKK